MGDTSERDSLKRIVSEKPNQQEVSDVMKDFAKMQKLRAESLKREEDMMQCAEHELDNFE